MVNKWIEVVKEYYLKHKIIFFLMNLNYGVNKTNIFMWKDK